MSSIESRIKSMSDALRRRKMEQEEPVDPLSLSLFKFQEWLSSLDEDGRRELLEELNATSEDGTRGLDLCMEDLDRMIGEARA